MTEIFRNLIGGKLVAIMVLTFSLCLDGFASGFTVSETENTVEIRTERYTIKIVKQGFRYAFLHPSEEVWLDHHTSSGLVFLNSEAQKSNLLNTDDEKVTFKVTNTLGVTAHVVIEPKDTFVKMGIFLEGGGNIRGSVIARTSGLSPAYGLGDHAARRKNESTEVSGFYSRSFGALTDNEPSRLVSNFVVFPKQGVGVVSVEPDKKIVKVSQSELAQGVTYGASIPSLYYFFGEPQQIYSDFKKIRGEEGYKVYLPKYEWFGIGWEAWGALAWDTNERTVKANVDQYLDLGFPLDWMVVGSGFWPKDDETLLSTTSFGLWDSTRYPNPKGFIDYFHEKGLKFMLGLRIAFIPNGPFTQEGIDKGYFIMREGQPRLFRLSFPKPECYFLDAQNPQAVAWYAGLCKKWLDAGVDGFKEDLFGYEIGGLRDDKIDPVNEQLMDMGVYVMGRNGYLGSPMDLHRFEDFNYDQNQDRGPINGLGFAYTGFPYVYPDIVCGKGLHNMEFGEMTDDRLKTYFMRNARYASVNPSMSFGYGVWNLKDDSVTEIVRDAAQDHHRLHPFLYSAAVRTHQTGFPYTMAPLPLAYPKDDQVHNRENNRVRGYQWLINETLLATPLYGNDYHEVSSRDVYLPEGRWIDYDNGQVYEGPVLLDDFEIPVEKSPLFVGGSGFVVEQIGDALVGRIYPTGFKGKVTFYHRDGSTESTVEIKKEVSAQSRIKDMTTGSWVKVEKDRYAYQFAFIPGHNYEVR